MCMQGVCDCCVCMCVRACARRVSTVIRAVGIRSYDVLVVLERYLTNVIGMGVWDRFGIS